MDKNKGFLTVFIVSATVFFSNACIMTVELVASRLVARNLGSSLYTWTSIIGIVLAGISIGNYIGGRLADKYNPRKTLSLLFCLASIACVAIIILNNVIGEWVWLWQLSWPVRVFLHVSLVFLLPSVLLGTISPVAATMALKTGLPTGRTIGEIYAWAAVGSIAGTFLTGFYLIASIGTVNIIWIIAGALLVMGIIYYVKMWVLYIWAVIFILLLTMGMAPYQKAIELGGGYKLREKHDPAILYQDETQYCWVAVKQTSKEPDHRLFMQDKLKHSEIIMGNLDDLRDFYIQMFAAITRHLAGEKKTISALTIGGGGYIFPQYIEKYWPGSRNDVAEIDPGVTKAAMAGFGLREDALINTIQLDARNYIDTLLNDRRMNKETPLYNFIYEDAFNDYNVPFQLVTKEFNDKIYDILADDGIYIINMIDVLDKGVFMPAYLNTLQQTFPYLYIVSQNAPESFRSTFIITAAKIPVDIERSIHQYKPDLEYRFFDAAQTKAISAKADGLILSDDFAPTENLLQPVVKQSAIEFLTHRYRTEALRHKKEGNYTEAIDSFKKMIETDFTASVEALNEIALLSAQLGKPDKAIEAFLQAIDANEKIKPSGNMANVHFSLAIVLQSAGRTNDATEHFNLAIAGFEKELAKIPSSVKYLMLLGDSYASKGDFLKASEYFSKAVGQDPSNMPNHIKLIQSLEYAGQIDTAIAAANRSIDFFQKNNQDQAANQIRLYLQRLQQYKK
jgi:tetratricopeptide (TPR) repeat protein/MFS family permease